MPQNELTADELTNLRTLMQAGRREFSSLQWQDVAESLYNKLGRMRDDVESTTNNRKDAIR